MAIIVVGNGIHAGDVGFKHCWSYALKTSFILGIFIAAFCLSFVSAQASERLTPIALGKLLDNRKWAMTFGGGMTYWDWKKDGNLCARFIGDLNKDGKCADEGKWQLEGDKLCWQLTWLFRGHPLNEQCVVFYRTTNGGFEAHRIDMSGNASDSVLFNLTIAQ